MFEDSTFESTGRIRTRSRRWMMATFVLNGSILLTLVLIPLLYPEALPGHMLSILIQAPPAPPPQPKPVAQTPKQAFHGAPQMDGATLIAPRLIPRPISMLDRQEAPAPVNNFAMDSGPDAGTGIREAFRGHGAAVAPAAPKGPVPVASTISSGLLLYRTVPVYPAIAKAARRDGVVVLEATISKSGTIENLRVVSGDPMLQRAALDAVSNWRYKPYLLNGQPVEVETTVNVIFRLSQ